MYNKLFTKILDSSIWLAPDPHRLVWITLIAAMDEDGNAMFACADNLAARARVSVRQAEAAIKAFEAPDPKSGDPDNEGRRIERFPGGWKVLNAHKYRALVSKAIIREQTRIRTERWRKKIGDAPVTQRDESVTTSEALALALSEAGNTTTAAPRPGDEEFKAFKALYPERNGSQPWQRARRAIDARLREGATWEQILDGTRRYAAWCKATGKLGTETVKQAATFCGPEREFLKPWNLPATRADVRLAGNLDAFAQAKREIFGGAQ